MNDRPEGGPDNGSQGPRDDQWTSVDGPAQPPHPGEHPQTRAFESPVDQWGRPAHDQAGYPASGYQQQPYSQPYGQGPYTQNEYGQDPYGQGQYGQDPYGQTGYQQASGQAGQYPPGPYPPGQYPGGDGAAAPEPPGGRSSRTLWLIAAVVALLVVVVLVAGYFLVRTSDDSVADPSSTPFPTAEEPFPSAQESVPPSSSFPGSEPTASAAPGQILYTLTGDGQILGVTYSALNSTKISPRLITPPWAVATDVAGAPSLIAVVLRGQITCTITLDGRVLDTATSSTGLLRCQAPAQ